MSWPSARSFQRVRLQDCKRGPTFKLHSRASIRLLQLGVTCAKTTRVTRASFDAARFFKALDSQRSSRKLLWKNVAEQAKVSQSTLTRLAQGKRPDVDSLAALVDWGGFKADDFVIRVHEEREAEPLAMISTYLRADRNLSPAAADAMEQVLRATYEALRQP
jgi:transcriptional regulator with XRE-family HTH domain